jgi:hypothetical protein
LIISTRPWIPVIKTIKSCRLPFDFVFNQNQNQNQNLSLSQNINKASKCAEKFRIEFPLRIIFHIATFHFTKQRPNLSWIYRRPKPLSYMHRRPEPLSYIYQRPEPLSYTYQGILLCHGLAFRRNQLKVDKW